MPDQVFAPEQISPWLKVAVDWLRGQPVVVALILLMFADVVTGICCSIAKRTLSSSTSWRGMSRKAMMLLIVGVGAILEPLAQGIPLAKLIALFYIATEVLSITENAAIMGVPLPKVLIDLLIKLREDNRASSIVITQPGAPTVRMSGPIEITAPKKETIKKNTR
jgi:toxin secretion/phage lysis holin